MRPRRDAGGARFKETRCFAALTHALARSAHMRVAAARTRGAAAGRPFVGADRRCPTVSVGPIGTQVGDVIRCVGTEVRMAARALRCAVCLRCSRCHGEARQTRTRQRAPHRPALLAVQPIETYQQLEAILRAATPLQSYKFHVHNERRTVERAAAASHTEAATLGTPPSGPYPRDPTLGTLPSGPHPRDPTLGTPPSTLCAPARSIAWRCRARGAREGPRRCAAGAGCRRARAAGQLRVRIERASPHARTLAARAFGADSARRAGADEERGASTQPAEPAGVPPARSRRLLRARRVEPHGTPRGDDQRGRDQPQRRATALDTQPRGDVRGAL